MCQVHTGAYVSLLAPGKTDYTACHPRKTTTYILHVESITTHTHNGPITRSTAVRGCHVSLCWGALCSASCWLLFGRNMRCARWPHGSSTPERPLVRRIILTGKYNIFFFINMNMKQLLYIGQSDACTTKLANGTHTAL